MNHSYRFTACSAFLLILFIGLPSIYAQEDPRLWDTDGVALRQGTQIVWQQASAGNDDGQTCIVWSDTRSGTRDIYAQMIAPDGTPSWETDGLLIARTEWNSCFPVVTPVNGGWIIAWLANVTVDGELYWTQRVYA